MKYTLPLAIIGLAVAGTAGYALAGSTMGTRNQTQDAPASGVVTGIGALGTLEPAGRIRIVAAPGPSARLADMLVEEGEEVAKDQVLAHTDDHAVRLAELTLAQNELGVAEAQVVITQSGTKEGDLAAQRAAIETAECELVQRRRDLQRAESLGHAGIMPEANIEAARLAVATAQARLAENEARLAALAQVRPTDVALRQRQVDAAQAVIGVARAALERTVILSPIAGRVLRVYARAGQQVPTEGILTLGNVRLMHVVSEVYEADVPRIRLGMKAVVRVKSTDLILNDARVVTIGSSVGRKVALDNDPVTDTDARVVEVRIALGSTDSARVAGLTNARVEVVLQEQP